MPQRLSVQDGEGSSAYASYCNITMAGQDVFKFAVRSVPAVRNAVKGRAAAGVAPGRCMR
jgi:3-oxoacyl-[acyl-carrier-protein] synthase-3